MSKDDEPKNIKDEEITLQTLAVRKNNLSFFAIFSSSISRIGNAASLQQRIYTIGGGIKPIQRMFLSKSIDRETRMIDWISDKRKSSLSSELFFMFNKKSRINSNIVIFFKQY